ncbi:hypothetical protein PAHAL_9G290800 [Panicum hallii]|uniref:EGF-like calcium-binding domain-containing protein n=1 Tax=Panicum hallii TaxID=206008 RepID=A0A2S3IMB7_9POAL|nr:hypothetical protein PAHAL_9G290800 [Panicum hallii]
MDWEVGSHVLRPQAARPQDATCPRHLDSAACHSSHSTCRATTGPNKYKRHSLEHTTGYVCMCDQGYLGNPYLAQGYQDINECKISNKCFGNCTNLPGLIIDLGAGSGEMILVPVISSTFIIRMIQRPRRKRMRLWFFKRNRGQLTGMVDS